MPTADTTARDYTAAEVTAYEAYLSAVAEHNIICARAGATTRDKMDAAFAADRAWKRFAELGGFDSGKGTRSPEDIRTIDRLKAELGDMTEAVRSAWAMLVAVDGIDVIQRLPDDKRLADPFNASFTLLGDATVILRSVLRKADGE